jgi:hypothetical protein
MAAETIHVYIDTAQVQAQKNNNYSLYLAKKVNGQFTVIWQSKGPVATVNHPSYEYKNTFTIEVPNYEVNYGTVTEKDGSVTFNASGKPQTISIGQTVILDDNGLFADPKNDGTAGEIIIHNALANNPNVILLDDEGNPIFVNTTSGMDIGDAELTPIDTYQIWFDNYQDTGTIISHQVSNIATVVFDGGTTEKTISYNTAGEWQTGPLSQKLDIPTAGLAEVDPLTITVLATFKYALTVTAVTYLLHKLVEKFGVLQPTHITAAVGSTKLTVKFAGPRVHEILAAFGTDKYETAVGNALSAAKKDKLSDLQKETWTVSESTVGVSY